MMSANIMRPSSDRLSVMRLVSRIKEFSAGGVIAISVSAIVCVGSLFAEEVLAPLRYDRAGLGNGEWWRLISGHLVHINLRHGLLNAAALILTVSLVAGRVAISEWLWLTVGSVVAVDAGLYWLSPEIAWHVGASGVLHGLFAGVGLLLAARSRDPLGGLLLLLLAGKLAFEQLSGGASPWMADANFTIVTEAHLYGAIGGLASAMILLGSMVAKRRVN